MKLKQTQILSLMKWYTKKILSFFFRKKIITGVSIFNHKDVKVYKIHGKDIFEAPTFKDIFDKTHPLFNQYTSKIPESYVAVITNGRCILGREEVFSSTNEVFIEITTQKQNPMVGKFFLRNCKKLQGTVVNLSLSGLEDNYYHFCVEWMARLYLLKKINIEPDYYIVPQKLSFQKQYLDLLQIDHKKRISSEDNSFIQADKLIVPSLINNWEPIKIKGYDSYCKQWIPKWFNEVHSILKIDAVEDSFPNSGMVYISRKFSNFRKVLNEKEITDFLKEKGFGIYYLESMTVKEQISLFKNAQIIVSLSGAGLANMIHCAEPAIVFTIYTENYNNPCIRLLALSLGHDYYYYIGQSPDSQNVHPLKENVYIDLVAFKQAIQTILEKNIIKQTAH